MSTDPWAELRRYLASGYGDELLSQFLAPVWDEIAGLDEEGTTGEKLWRMEDVRWQPPLLTFQLERHGATVMGSTRGEVHEWEVNLDTRTASIVRRRRRQLYPMQPRLKVEPLVRDVVRLIEEKALHPWLAWAENGTRVTIRTGQIIPASSGPKETVTGRRKRLRKQLTPAMASIGWHPSTTGVANTYVRLEPAS